MPSRSLQQSRAGPVLRHHQPHQPRDPKKAMTAGPRSQRTLCLSTGAARGAAARISPQQSHGRVCGVVLSPFLPKDALCCEKPWFVAKPLFGIVTEQQKPCLLYHAFPSARHEHLPRFVWHTSDHRRCKSISSASHFHVTRPLLQSISGHEQTPPISGISSLWGRCLSLNYLVSCPRARIRNVLRVRLNQECRELVRVVILDPVWARSLTKAEKEII